MFGISVVRSSVHNNVVDNVDEFVRIRRTDGIRDILQSVANMIKQTLKLGNGNKRKRKNFVRLNRIG